MSLIFNFFEKHTRYYKLKPRELRASIVTIIVMTFAITFNKWGPGKEVDLAYGFSWLVGALLIVAISFFFRLFFQRSWGIAADYWTEYKMWSIGLLILLVLVFITNGRFWFLIPGAIVIWYPRGHRLGWIRYGLNYYGVGVVGVSGPIANIILAIIFKIIYEFTGSELIQMAFILNLLWAVWTILPIPPSDGFKMFYGSRMVYMFAFAIIISSAVLLYINLPIWITIPAAFIIAIIWYVVYWIVWERFNWKGPY